MTKHDKHLAYRNKNRGLLRAKQASRRAGPAAPSWLTAEQAAEIVALYELAELLTATRGIEHEVDHLVPLKGVCPFTGRRNVCGLHLPLNLRVVPKGPNRRKADIYFTGLGPAVEPDDDIPF